MRKELSNSIKIELIPEEYARLNNNILGSVIDVSTGKPVEGAIITIRPGMENKNHYVSKEFRTVTDRNGSYTFSNIQTGYTTGKYWYVFKIVNGELIESAK